LPAYIKQGVRRWCDWVVRCKVCAAADIEKPADGPHANVFATMRVLRRGRDSQVRQMPGTFTLRSKTKANGTSRCGRSHPLGLHSRGVGQIDK